MSKIKNLIFLIFVKLSSFSPLCEVDIKHCSRCNPITKLCVKCDKDIYSPDENGGCQNAKKCILGHNNCIQCNEKGNLCEKCLDGYFPDENGGCSYTDNCEISYEGQCLECKTNFILIGLNNSFYEGIKICKSIVLGDLKNCLIINRDLGYCEECKKGYFLNFGDKKCTKVENCYQSTFDICTKCNNGYYLNKKENKCLFQDEIFGNCLQTLDGKTCDVCEEDFYFNEENKCNAINFCSKSKNNYSCEKCISGYYLTQYGTTCTQEKNCYSGNKDLGICLTCIDNYYIDYMDGKCKSNQEENDFKYCFIADNNKCQKCISKYKLSIDNKCSLSSNCAEVDNGECIVCEDNYHLGYDNRCTNIDHCIYSNDYECIECENNYYFNRTKGLCQIGEGNLKNCKLTDKGDYCIKCKDDFYLNKKNNLCYNNQENNNFYKCAMTDDTGELCNECIKEYYLGDKDNKCSKIEGCLLSENENKCIECDEYYCLDINTGKCVINDEIIDEEKKFYFKCNKTNKAGNACEICNDGYILSEDGLCFDNVHCVEKDQDGKCKICKKNENDNIDSFYCLNNYFGCIELFKNDRCQECNNILDFYNCTKCFDEYELNRFGLCD